MKRRQNFLLRRRLDVSLRRGILVIALAVTIFGGYRFYQAQSGAPTVAATRVVNINTATTEEIDRLPGVNQELATRIVAGRPYASVDLLARVPGITPERLEELRPYLTVED